MTASRIVARGPRWFACLLALLSLPLSACAQSPRVEYRVVLDQPQTQMVDIEVTLRGVDDEQVDLMLPVWRPGRYEVLDMAGTVRGERATNAAGEPLPWRKVDKSTWRIDTGGASEVSLRYRLYANEIRSRTRHVDETHAFLSGSAVFMYSPEYRDEPLRVIVEAPEGWRIATGLEPDPSRSDAVIAPNYDILVDSPLEIGEHELIEFDAAGKPHEIVIWGRGSWDAEELREDFAKIVEEQVAIFGGVPYDRYVFMIHCNPGMGGGTEHINSTIMGARPEVFESQSAYEGFLGLVSHEYFHTWNVKQFRPSGINPYDYQRENYTDLLWVSEGTTSYYDDLTLARAGLISVSKYLDRLSGTINGHRKSPGRLEQSLSESSFDAWVKFNQRNDDTHNYTVNFYGAGSMASLLLDLELRRRTGGRVTLDDAMRVLYERFPLSGPGFTQADLRELLAELAGSSFDEIFDRYIDGRESMPLEDALTLVGLELALDSDETEPYLGLSLGGSAGSATVSRVNSDGPAYRAGLIVGDEIVAMNGEKLSLGDLGDRLEDLEPGEPARFVFFRWNRLMEREVTPIEYPRGNWKVRKVKEPTEAQRAAFEAWLGQPWD